MKLPASPEANQKQNAVVVVVQQPGTSRSPLGGFAEILGESAVGALRKAIFADLSIKLRQWAEYSTCFLLADESLAEHAPELTERYERLEFTGDKPRTFREGLGLLLEAVWEQNFRRVVFVDAMAPSLPAGLMRDAFEWLWERDVVIGPSLAGGCYLVGLRDLEARALPESSWHEAGTFLTAVDQVREAGLTIQLVDYWNVVSVPPDLALLYTHLAAQAAHGSATGGGFDGAKTWDALNEIVEGPSLLADPRFRALVGNSRGEAAQASAPGTDRNGSDVDADVGRRRPSGRPLPAGGAPAPLPSEVQVRPRRGER